jgi:hypothetical protein
VDFLKHQMSDDTVKNSDVSQLEFSYFLGNVIVARKRFIFVYRKTKLLKNYISHLGT